MFKDTWDFLVLQIVATKETKPNKANDYVARDRQIIPCLFVSKDSIRLMVGLVSKNNEHGVHNLMFCCVQFS